MTNRPNCSRGQRKRGSPCIFCEDGAYCAHQYYCPATGRYENTGFRECRRLTRPAHAAEKAEEKPKAEAPVEAVRETEKNTEEDSNGTQKIDRRRRRKG